MTGFLGFTIVPTLLAAAMAQADDLNRLDFSKVSDTSYRSHRLEEIKLGSKVYLFLRQYQPVQPGVAPNVLFQQWAYQPGEKIVDTQEGDEGTETLTVEIKSTFDPLDLMKRQIYRKGMIEKAIPEFNDWSARKAWQSGLTVCKISSGASGRKINRSEEIASLRLVSVHYGIKKSIPSAELILSDDNNETGFRISCQRPKGDSSSAISVGDLEAAFAQQVFLADADFTSSNSQVLSMVPAETDSNIH